MNDEQYTKLEKKLREIVETAENCYDDFTDHSFQTASNIFYDLQILINKISNEMEDLEELEDE